MSLQVNGGLTPVFLFLAWLPAATIWGNFSNMIKYQMSNPCQAGYIHIQCLKGVR